MRGDGTLYLRGNVWWASYVVRGQRVRTSTGIEGNAKGLGRREANDWLKQRQADAKQGIATHDKVTLAGLVEELFKHYELNGHKSKDKHRWDLHLSPFFGKCNALDVTAPMIRQYVSARKGQKNAHGKIPENATINRELALLRRAYNLALRDERLRHMPSFKQVMLPEDNVREGFLRDEDYSKLADEASKVGLWLRTLLALYYNYGWRKSEAAKHLKVSQIDLADRSILLSRRSTKNKKPKRLKMCQEVYELLAACIALKIGNRCKGPDDLAITREDGSPAGDFRKAWHSVCVAAGLPDLLVHDLRRSAVRNLRRLGFAEKTIMEISGHRTANVFRRYDIQDEADLAQVAAALGRKRQADQSQLSHNSLVAEKQPKVEHQQEIKIQ